MDLKQLTEYWKEYQHRADPITSEGFMDWLTNKLEGE